MKSNRAVRVVLIILVLVLLTTFGAFSRVVYAAAFNIGDTVEVYNTGSSGLVVRDTACGTQIGGKFDGARGTVLDGPTFCSSYNRWKIRWDDDGLVGWSAEDWLRKVIQPPSPPTHSSPSNAAIGVALTPTFTWYSVSDADYYGLYISEPPYGSSNLVYDSESDYGNIPGTSITLPSGILSPGVKYYWNMRSHNGAGWGSFSTSWYFTTAVPVDNVPTISINSPSNNQHFTYSTSGVSVQGIANDDHQVTLVQVRVNSGSWTTASGTTSWNKSVNLAVGANTIEARAKDDNSQHSAIASIVVYRDEQQLPPAPTHRAPSNGATEQILTPTFQWDSVSGADYYGLYISEPPWDSSHLVYDSEVDYGHITGTSITLPSGILIPGVMYYWNMRSHNSAGWGSFSTSWYFTTTSPAGEITVTSPNGGESWPVGRPRTITWTSSGISGNVRIDLSRNGGSSWETIIDSTANDGSEEWTVTGPTTNQSRVRVVSLNNTSISDVSNANFTILEVGLNVTSPNGGETWTSGDSHIISWSVSGSASYIDYFWVRYSLDGGNNWTSIETATADARSYTWSIPDGTSSTQSRIMIRALDANGWILNEDISDSNFTIETPIIIAKIKGIDVSHYQGDINWSQVYSGGYRFAFVKATEGDANPPQIIDSNFETNMVNGKNAGMLVGAYHFAWPQYNNAQDEAQFFVDVASDYITEGYLRPVLDLEQGEGLGKEALSNWVHTWMQTVESETGVEPILYVNSNFANNYLDSSIIQYDLWIAHWTYNPESSPNTGIWDTWNFWQYSDQGSVLGINGNVDLDLFNGDESELQAFVISNIDTSAPTVDTFSVEPEYVALGDAFTIYYEVSDMGGSGLKQVELWRANDNNGAPGSWGDTPIDTIPLSGSGPSSGDFHDSPHSVGTYWYGIHVIDNAENWMPEDSPVKVEVIYGRQQLVEAVEQLRDTITEAIDRNTHDTADSYAFLTRAATLTHWWSELARLALDTIHAVVDAVIRFVDFLTPAGGTQALENSSTLHQVINGLKDSREILGDIAVFQGLIGLYRNADSYKLLFESINEIEEAARQQYQAGYDFIEVSDMVWAQLASASGPEVPLRAGSPLRDGSRPGTIQWAKGTKDVNTKIKEDFNNLLLQIPDPLPQGYDLGQIISYLDTLTQQIRASQTIGGGAYINVKFKDLNGSMVKQRPVTLGMVSDGRQIASDLFDAWLNKLQEIEYTTYLNAGETILHVTSYGIPASGVTKQVMKGVSDLYELADLIQLPGDLGNIIDKQVDPLDALQYHTLKMTNDLVHETANLWAISAATDKYLRYTLGQVGDTTPPETFITAYVLSPSFDKVTLSWEGYDDQTSASALIYSYYLQGYSTSWSQWTASTSQQYSDLYEGDYTFKVKAKDQASNEDPTPAEYSFSIGRPSQPDYPKARWIPSPNYQDSGRNLADIEYVVIHTMQGTLQGTISWFQTTSSEVSSHYLVGSNGEIVQMVKEEDVAWHAKDYNSASIGVEHEGWTTDPNWSTEAMYQASADLVRYLCQKYNIPIDRAHILGHDEIYDRPDPGQYWDWDKFMRLVRGETSNLVTITVAPDSPSIVAGRTQQFTATGTYSDGSTADLTSSVAWTSSNTGVARINTSGLATGYSEGSTTITATSASISGNATLTVGPVMLDSIVITPVNPTIAFVSGNPPTIQFNATAIYSDGATEIIAATANWSSSSTSVATVEGNTGLATTVTAGTTTISAGYGVKTGNTTLTVLTDTVPPRVNLVNPTKGMITNSNNLAVSGKVNDLSASVYLIVNSGTPIPLTIDAGGDFSKEVSLNTGSNTVLVIAIDESGNVGTSGTITVTVKPNLPNIKITQPASNLVTNNQSLMVAGTISGQVDSLILNLNGVPQSVKPSGDTFSANVTLAEGLNVLVSYAYNVGHVGDINYLGTSGVRMVSLDTTPPVITIDTPTLGAIVSTPGCDVSGTVNDPDVSTANITVNGMSQLIPVVGGTFSQKITLASGNNTIAVMAIDDVGNTASASVTVNADNTKPEVTITSPANGLVTNIDSLTVEGTVNDPTINTATLYLNGTTQAISVSSGSFSKNVTLVPGGNALEVKASDTASPPNTGTSGLINATLDNTAPKITIGLSDPADSITITLASNEALITAPTVIVNSSTTVAMTQIDVNRWNGTFGNESTPIASGQYTVSANATDKAGNTTTKKATFCKQTVTITDNATATVQTDTATVQFSTTANVTDASVSVTQHLENPSGNVGNPEGAENAAGAFVEIVVSPELRDNLEQVYIRVNYDLVELPAGTDESTLKLYLWDVASGTWQLVPDSGVNTTEHYIYGTVTHLSTYGGFGTATAPAPPTPAPPAGGGGGGGGTREGETYVSDYVTSAGQFVAAVTAKSDDGKVRLTIDKGVVGKTESGRRLQKITITEARAPSAPPADSTIVGLTYDLGPDGATFDPPVHLTFKYDTDELPAGVNEENLVVAMWDEGAGEWVVLEGCTVNPVTQTITAPVSHFTVFTVLSYIRPAAFTTSALSISPAEVEIGGSVTISVLVSNAGDLADSYEVVLEIDDVAVASEDIDLAGGGSQQVTFTIARDVAGTCTVNINGLSGTFTVKPGPPPTPAFSTSALSISPTELDIGESVTISVLVSNTGDLAGSYEVVLKIDDVAVASKDVDLAGGYSQQATFTIARDVAGTYTVNINGLSGTFTVKTVPAPAAFTTSALTVSPTMVEIGESVTISILVSNTGDLADSYEVTLEIDDVTVASEDVDVAGGGSQQVTFTTAKDVAGTYTVNINGLSDTFTVRTPTVPPFNWGLIGGIIAGCVVAAGLPVYFFVWRKRSAPRLS